MKATITIINLFLLLHSLKAQILVPTEDEGLVTFKVTDFQELPEEEATITVSGIDTSLVKSGVTSVDGTLQVLLPEGKKYSISVNKFGEDFDFSKPLTLPSLVGTLKFEHKLKIRIITEYLRTYTLDNVYFDFNKYDIKKESTSSLELLFNTLKDNKQMKVEIAGHTDDVGDDKLNLLLSQKRADEVMKYLLKKGIERDRILAKGYGETSPVASNTDEEGRQKNRRTEVRVIAE